MPPLEFRLDVRPCARHRIDVALELDPADRDPDGGVTLFLPVWTPGSYMVREYARHIEQLRAVVAETDSPVPWRKTAKNRFRLEPDGSAGRVRVSYTVYGRELTVRTADFTDRRAFWNAACVLLWPVGAQRRPARIDVALPEGWTMSTQLEQSPIDGGVRLEAANLDEVIDAPCLAGLPEQLPFDVRGVPHSFVLDGLEGVEVPDTLVPDTQRIIEEAAAMFGDALPYERYEFLSLFTDTGRGGLEHMSSSALLAPRTTFRPRKEYEDFMGLVAHELFHVWNGKRMRPRELQEFEYERENYTTLLWVVEGMTAYYDDHLCLRAGVLDRDRYLGILSENITQLHRTPGRLVHPLSAASFDAWIKLYRPDENTRNSTQSYYTHGALAAMCFDLTIRAASDGQRCLDDAIGELYRESAGEGGGYDDAQVIACLSRAAGKDMAPLVAELIDGPFDPDFDAFLAPVGLKVVAKSGDDPQLGIHLAAKELRITSVIASSPAARGGLAPGDEILALNGLRVLKKTWSAVLRNVHSPGDPIAVLVSRRGHIQEVRVRPKIAPASLRIEPIAGATGKQVELRKQWLWEDS